MKTSIFKLIFLFSFSVQYCYAAEAVTFYNGNELYNKLVDWKSLNTNNALSAGFGAGYVIGVADAYNGKPSPLGNRFCLSPSISSQQVIDVVTIFLANNPQDRHKTASSLVSYSLSNAFPCK